VLISKQSFSQMGLGPGLCQMWKARPNAEAGATCNLEEGGEPIGPVQTSRFRLSQYAPRGRPATILYGGWQERIAHAVAATGEGCRSGIECSDQQVGLPGPVRTRADGRRLSGGGVVRPCEAGGCRGDCRGAPGRRPACGAAAAGRGVHQYEELSAPCRRLMVSSHEVVQGAGRCAILIT
jgi:hypothetical protein